MGEGLELKAGDIFLVSGQGFFSRGIRRFTRGRGEAETIATHVGVVVSDGTFETATVVEALGHGVVRRSFAESIGSQPFSVIRPLNLSPDAIKTAVAFAHRNVNCGYGWLKIGAQLGDFLIPWRNKKGHPPYFFRRIAGADRWPFCSFLVDGFVNAALVYDAVLRYGAESVNLHALRAGIRPFGVEQNCCQPDDIDDFATAYPKIYSRPVPWPES